MTNRVLQVLPSTNGIEVSVGSSVHPTNNFPLCEHGEALVQPEVLKVGIGHEVSGPRVSNLVSDDVGQRLVPSL